MERGGTQLSPSSFPSSFARGRQRVRMQLTAEKKKGEEEEATALGRRGGREEDSE